MEKGGKACNNRKGGENRTEQKRHNLILQHVRACTLTYRTHSFDGGGGVKEKSKEQRESLAKM